LLDQQAAGGEGSQRFADIPSLRGRLWKDAFHRAPTAPTRRRSRSARKEYLAAYALQRPYPGINAATLSLLLGDLAAARSRAEDRRKLAAQTTPRTCWDHATAGGAHLVGSSTKRGSAIGSLRCGTERRRQRGDDAQAGTSSFA
jgi:hypothetical protein